MYVRERRTYIRQGEYRLELYSATRMNDLEGCAGILIFAIVGVVLESRGVLLLEGRREQRLPLTERKRDICLEYWSETLFNPYR